MVGAGALHPVAAVLDAAPEVAAAYNNCDFRTQFMCLLNAAAYFLNCIHIQAKALVPAEGLAAQLEQHPAILHRHMSHRQSHIFRFVVIPTIHDFASKVKRKLPFSSTGKAGRHGLPAHAAPAFENEMMDAR